MARGERGRRTGREGERQKGGEERKNTETRKRREGREIPNIQFNPHK